MGGIYHPKWLVSDIAIPTLPLSLCQASHLHLLRPRGASVASVAGTGATGPTGPGQAERAAAAERSLAATREATMRVLPGQGRFGPNVYRVRSNCERNRTSNCERKPLIAKKTDF